MPRRARLGAAVLLCVAAAAAIVALLVADSILVEINLAYTAAGLVVFGVPVALGMSVTGPFRWVGRLASAVAVAAFGFMMGSLWSVDEFGDSREALTKLFGSTGIFAFALAYAATMLDGVRNDDGSLVTALMISTVFAALAVAAMVTVAVVGETGSATYWRIASITGVAGALAGALTPLARGTRAP